MSLRLFPRPCPVITDPFLSLILGQAASCQHAALCYLLSALCFLRCFKRRQPKAVIAFLARFLLLPQLKVARLRSSLWLGLARLLFAQTFYLCLALCAATTTTTTSNTVSRNSCHANCAVVFGSSPSCPNALPDTSSSVKSSALLGSTQSLGDNQNQQTPVIKQGNQCDGFWCDQPWRSLGGISTKL